MREPKEGVEFSLGIVDHKSLLPLVLDGQSPFWYIHLLGYLGNSGSGHVFLLHQLKIMYTRVFVKSWDDLISESTRQELAIPVSKLNKVPSQTININCKISYIHVVYLVLVLVWVWLSLLHLN